ncbi:pilus assembly protein [Hydrogenophaga sp.]|uniref:pilus assembly protein n=1 Tax=Hydrogenophaga sp. TaxID=1904254 RepID=UPI003F6C2AF2
MKNKNLFGAMTTKSGRVLLGLTAAFSMVTASTAQVGIAQSPLFLSKAVTPSILIALDDSGSMDAEILLPTNDGAAWWNTADGSFAGRGRFDVPTAGANNFNEAGSAGGDWRKYIYVFPVGGGGNTEGRRAYSDAANDHFAVPPLPAYAYVRSSDYNLSYFNPAVQYTPWPSLGSYSFGNSPPKAARTDPTMPVTGTPVTIDLTAQIENNAANHVFRLFDGMTVPAGVRNAPEGGNWGTAAYVASNTNNEANRRAISYYPAHFYLRSTTNLPACFGFNATSVKKNGSGPDGTTVMYGYEIKEGNFSAACGRTAAANYALAIQNFANWFTYYRKRHAAARNAIAVGFESITDFRAGLYRINAIPSPASALSMRDLLLPADRKAFFDQAFTSIGVGGTPNREAVNAMRSQLARTDANAPIRLECQKNFGVLITDGFANPSTSSGVGNRDGVLPAPLADIHSDTIADIAAALYIDNPRPTLPAGKVPVPPECALGTASLRVDCNPNLHLNLYAISLGAPGNIFGVNKDSTADPFANPPTWPNPDQFRSPQQIDDLWHATLNSRADMLSVEIPSELGTSFRRVLDSIRARVEASGGSAATSSAVLQTASLLFNASFRSADWSGTLIARKLLTDGRPGAVVWNAEELLNQKNPDTRKIFTSTTPGSPVTLTFSALSTAQKASLEVNPPGASATTATGADRIAWLRGQEHVGLRSRTFGGVVRRMGDIIGSSPQYLSNRDYGYSALPEPQGSAYKTFRSSATYRSRPEVLLFGSNGGMFHGIRSDTGDELFAYMPSELLSPPGSAAHARVNELMRPDYTHRFFVDGSAALGDAYISGKWRSVVVGTMGAGGRTVFALDVTNPGSFGAGNVLWEFAHSELGQGVTKPSIVRLKDGRWAAVFGNGYNSASHQPQLFVVDLSDGSIIHNIKLVGADGASQGSVNKPNGLSPVEATDWPANDLSLANVYAGDLYGNLWRVNLRSAQPAVTRLFQAVDTSSPARSQSITAAPKIALKPGSSSEVVLLFGTGSFFREGDDSPTAPQVQTMYGVFDGASAPVSNILRGSLLVQVLSSNADSAVINTVTYPAGSLRFLTRNVPAAGSKGWAVDLLEPGERVISQPTFPSGSLQERVRFTSLIPDSDPCGSGRRGFVMDIDLLRGGRFIDPVFDLSGDGTFDSDDKVNGNDVSGIGGTNGEAPTTISSQDSNVDNLYSGDGRRVGTSSNNSGPVGRQSWRQIR